MTEVEAEKKAEEKDAKEAENKTQIMSEKIKQDKGKGRTSKRKMRIGVVSSNKMEKSITVLISRRKRHPLYGKTVPYSKKFVVHDEKNEAQAGDKVEVMETRPLSRTKRWRLVRVIEKKK